jgi:hypothetical protein
MLSFGQVKVTDAKGASVVSSLARILPGRRLDADMAVFIFTTSGAG